MEANSKPNHGATPSEILFFIRPAENGMEFEAVHCTKDEATSDKMQALIETGYTLVGQLSFQNGPVREVGGVNGLQIEHVLEELAKRLDVLAQHGHPTCRENSLTKTHIEEAILWQWRRTHNRHKRGVEGTSAS